MNNSITTYLTSLGLSPGISVLSDQKKERLLNAVKTVRSNIETKKEVLVIGASEIAYEVMNLYFHWYDKKRKRSKISRSNRKY